MTRSLASASRGPGGRWAAAAGYWGCAGWVLAGCAWAGCVCPGWGRLIGRGWALGRACPGSTHGAEERSLRPCPPEVGRTGPADCPAAEPEWAAAGLDWAAAGLDWAAAGLDWAAAGLDWAAAGRDRSAEGRDGTDWSERRYGSCRCSGWR
ncbi:hypothetical protein [Cryptosporangium minutisporangium]|uniref:hypothetical protein n=1 Tax=Cryptosporangium minutisporangium TaxID=113569 RepID=UPI0031EC79FE